MPSSIGHGLTALALGAAILPTPVPRRVAITGVACAVLLDLDAVGRPFGYGDVMWLGGHRAFTHSVFFAVVAGALLTVAMRRSFPDADAGRRVFAFFTAAMLAHGALDAFTDYGEGIAYLAPFSWRRFESTWEPLTGVSSEIVLIWLPTYILMRWLGHRGRARGLSGGPA